MVKIGNKCKVVYSKCGVDVFYLTREFAVDHERDRLFCYDCTIAEEAAQAKKRKKVVKPPKPMK